MYVSYRRSFFGFGRDARFVANNDDAGVGAVVAIVHYGIPHACKWETILNAHKAQWESPYRSIPLAKSPYPLVGERLCRIGPPLYFQPCGTQPWLKRKMKILKFRNVLRFTHMKMSNPNEFPEKKCRKFLQKHSIYALLGKSTPYTCVLHKSYCAISSSAGATKKDKLCLWYEMGWG